MKAITFLCFLFSLPLSIQAQAILEHTYPTTDLHRVHWTLSGESYWFSNDSLKEIKVYSSQHQLVKTIRYPSVLNSQVRLLKNEQAVTQTTVNADNLLEMVWFFKDTLTKKEQVKIMNERDSVLFVFNSAVDNIEFSEIKGLPSKLFVTTYEANLSEYITKVYDFPSLNLANTYFRAYRLHRKKFGYAGEKYFYKDATGKKMQIYNSDHSIWKTISLVIFSSITIDRDDSYTDADDNVISKDSLVEVIFSYSASGDKAQAIINENHSKVHKSNSALRVDHQNGLEDKLFQQVYRTNLEDYFRIHTFPNFTKQEESLYSVPLGRTLLKKYGEVIIRYYSSNFTLSYNNKRNSKTINLPTNSIFPYSIFLNSYTPIISDSLVNKDTLIDVIYTEGNYNNPKYATKIINEKGVIYNTIDSTLYFSINQSPTLSPKLITKTGNDKPYDTKVWRFNTTTPTKEAPSVLEAKIYPNPFSKNITIETQENTVFPLKIRLINALGEVVLATKTDQSKIDLALPDLTKGVYFLELTAENKRSVREIIKMD